MGDTNDMENLRIRMYIAEKWKRSYRPNKERISRNRVLQRLQQGNMVRPSTIKESVKTPKDKVILETLQNLRAAEKTVIVPLTKDVIELQNPTVQETNTWKYVLVEEDTTSEVFLQNHASVDGKVFGVSQAMAAIKWLVHKGTLMESKSQTEFDIMMKFMEQRIAQFCLFTELTTDRIFI